MIKKNIVIVCMVALIAQADKDPASSRALEAGSIHVVKEKTLKEKFLSGKQIVADAWREFRKKPQVSR